MFKKDQMSVWNWLGFTLLMMIPLVNLIMFIVILVSPDANKSLKNYLIAQLIFIVIIGAIAILFTAQFIDFIQGFLPA